ncbi:MAG: Oxidoreductase, short-chain dehydrogenase/reductase family [Rhodanobacteraceae bacterium]|jgi:3-oxoacyl-[acyl-carrier protein] reductase|nr:MAG: Oxidoreductase, short-chain dehydrogenase/reductase family [Rhodanobacteraceae bacterium]
MNTPFDFTGYRVAIAGGSKGIGRAIALGFLQAGATVAVCARGKEGLDTLRADAGVHADKLHTQPCDLAEADQIERWIAGVAQALGGLDVLVNNATGYGFREDDESWLADFNIDLMAAVRASRHALPYLKQSKHACILHTSSIGSFRPRTMGPPYAAMKAALNHYTRTQALALAEHRIRVNAIAPGSIEFEDGVWDRVKHEKPEQYAKVLATIPFGRYGTPEEVANLALFLASPWAGWITGQIMAVDGGQSLRF